MSKIQKFNVIASDREGCQVDTSVYRAVLKSDKNELTVVCRDGTLQISSANSLSISPIASNAVVIEEVDPYA